MLKHETSEMDEPAFLPSKKEKSYSCTANDSHT